VVELYEFLMTVSKSAPLYVGGPPSVPSKKSLCVLRVFLPFFHLPSPYF